MYSLGNEILNDYNKFKVYIYIYIYTLLYYYYYHYNFFWGVLFHIRDFKSYNNLQSSFRYFNELFQNLPFISMCKKIHSKVT